VTAPALAGRPDPQTIAAGRWEHCGVRVQWAPVGGAGYAYCPGCKVSPPHADLTPRKECGHDPA